jgi:hypothetical protein
MRECLDGSTLFLLNSGWIVSDIASTSSITFHLGDPVGADECHSHVEELLRKQSLRRRDE